MDRKQFTGLLIIFVMLFAYNYFFTPKPEAVLQQIESTTDIKNKNSSKAVITVEEVSSIPEQIFSLENTKLALQISSKGGSVSKVAVKNFTFADDKDLTILDKNSSKENTIIKINDDFSIDLSKFDFVIDKISENLLKLSTVITNLENTRVEILYCLEKNEYTFEKEITVYKDNQAIHYDSLSVNWHNALKNLEKDKKACTSKTTINYCSSDGDFDSLKENSSDPQKKDLSENVKWISLKQRFFSSAVVFEENDAKSVKLSMSPSENPDESSKKCNLEYTLLNNKKDNNSVKIKYYFGPNDFFKMRKVADQFYRNLPLGWAIVRWINMFIVLPLFEMMKSLVSNVGLLILVVSLLLKIVLLPITYKSYISALKMKLLKPDLENIKQKYGDDLHKIQVEHMKLYRESGVNPLGGILLLLIQMPILIAFFNFIPNEIFFRGKSFLWASDLSTYDSILSLPFSIPIYGDHISLFTILMTASTMLHTLTKTEMHESQQANMKIIMYLLPLVFMCVLNNFPAALSFYYLVSTLITIIIEFIMKKVVNQKKIEDEMSEKRKKFIHKPSFAERLQNMTTAKR